MITYVVVAKNYGIDTETATMMGVFSSMELANDAIKLWSEGKGYGTEYSVTEFVLDAVN